MSQLGKPVAQWLASACAKWRLPSLSLHVKVIEPDRLGASLPQLTQPSLCNPGGQASLHASVVKSSPRRRRARSASGVAPNTADMVLLN
jgi:hypothetical protein